INTDVAEYMPDGLIQELEDLPEESGGRRGRGRGDRGGRRDRSEGRGRGRGRRDRSERREEADTPAVKEAETAETETPKKNRKDRPKRDYKRKDDDPILDPAPDEVKGFGDEVPAFLKN
ncbi:MAG: RNA helicase, partial [Pseudomonadota bacterium]